jgi:hypothetical protein
MKMMMTSKTYDFSARAQLESSVGYLERAVGQDRKVEDSHGSHEAVGEAGGREGHCEAARRAAGQDTGVQCCIAALPGAIPAVQATSTECLDRSQDLLRSTAMWLRDPACRDWADQRNKTRCSCISP